jgi:hypothetical protein
MMTFRKITVAFIIFIISTTGNAQTKYELTHSFMSVGSRPQPYKGSIEINDSFLIFTALPNPEYEPNDTVTKVTKERIVKNKKGYYIKTLPNPTTAHNYTFELSENKEEKRQGIYYITMLVATNSGQRITIFFKGKLAN